MPIFILNSFFDTETGACIERNTHKEIHDEIKKNNPELELCLKNIDKECLTLKSKGYDLIYSIKFETSGTNEVS
jgi:hypothetical protein